MPVPDTDTGASINYGALTEILMSRDFLKGKAPTVLKDSIDQAVHDMSVAKFRTTASLRQHPCTFCSKAEVYRTHALKIQPSEHGRP